MRGLYSVLALLVFSGYTLGVDDVLATAIARVKAVGKEGLNNAQAAAAWRDLVKHGPAGLPMLLAALDDADGTAANWLRTAIDAITGRELQAGRPLPAKELEGFVKDLRHAGSARRLAYELLVKADGGAPARLLPGMLRDPSPELRRDAVARVLELADQALKKSDKPAAQAAFRKAFDAALDRDQVDTCVKQLETLGEKADVAGHFGFLQRWHLLGPFDNRDGVGFAKVYPPEIGKLDLTAPQTGKDDAKLTWIAHVTADPYGVVDLNKAVGKHMGATGYALAIVTTPAERPVELRAGSNNAIKLFLNGQELFGREEYHHGMRMDQHIGRGVLKAGRNTILVKVSQNEQKDDWAQGWTFQLRVCDAVGGPVPVGHPE